MKKFVFAAAAALAAIATMPAAATVLNLSSLPTGGFTQPVTIGDYILTPHNNGSSTPSIKVVNGVYVLAAQGGGNGDDTYLTRADGAAFTLMSVDIGLTPGSGSSGQNIASSAYTDNLNNVATSTIKTVALGTLFQNVTSVDLDANGGAYFANINVSSPAPEPATWALTIGGFGMIGAAMRRKRTVSLGFAG